MIEDIHQALLVTGKMEIMYGLHEAIKRKLRDADADFVRLLSPLTPGLANQYTSFILAPDGYPNRQQDLNPLTSLRNEIKGIVKEAFCSYVEMEYGSQQNGRRHFGFEVNIQKKI